MDKTPSFEHGQDIRDRTALFACRIVTFCEKVHAAGGVARACQAPKALANS